ncbi:unnamed protein product [Fusarium graminearum]|uniref:Chromosome 2, complete genome n=1 Tax=Gibberella zeae (strain ATCC MYA-4620 / CBS 123657 / FGSC 9075 / NRRL 31084 / PH-1) TaxID=229533 RepID=A0A0E0S8I5_GIBZE|nr:hypothetical protein FG05_35066 [Fusarium graminearum]CEF79810.1 unnamed protein product [Fusarium graminearum]CZS83117.1 unnamed protein product [Fusarium graminearum]
MRPMISVMRYSHIHIIFTSPMDAAFSKLVSSSKFSSMVQGHAILVEQNELSQVEFQTVTSAESTGMHQHSKSREQLNDGSVR